MLQNFFKNLLNPKDRAVSHSTSAMSPGAAGTIAVVTVSGKTQATGPRTSSGSGGSQTDLVFASRVPIRFVNMRSMVAAHVPHASNYCGPVVILGHSTCTMLMM